MKKFFITSDIHGFLNPLKEELKKKGFDKNNPDHILVVCGDLFDRGKEAVKLFRFIKRLGDRFIYVKGNHEVLLEKCVKEIENGPFYPQAYHFHNGTVGTILQFCGIDDDFYFSCYNKNCAEPGHTHYDLVRLIKKNVYPILDFIKKRSVNYFELSNYICCHSWIPENYKEADEYEWYKMSWVNPFEQWQLRKAADMLPEKTVICGHWSTSWARANIDQTIEYDTPYCKTRKEYREAYDIWTDEKIVALDSTVVISKFVNIFIIEE